MSDSLLSNDNKLSSKQKNENTSSYQAAAKVNLSEIKARKMDYIKEKSPEKYRTICKKDRLTVNKVYRDTRKEVRKKELEEKLRKVQVNIPESIQLHNKPFQELKIKDNSISLIITDPPYNEEHLYLYQDLANQAMKILKDGGSLVCYVPNLYIDRILKYIEDAGLTYHWIIAVIHSGPSATVHARKVMVGYKPLLWCVKGKYTGDYVGDVIKSEFQGKELHEWAQSTKESDYCIGHMTVKGETVYDPFLGQGTFGISAARLGRNFIGCETEKNHYENARRLISTVY